MHAELWRKVKEYGGNLQELEYNFLGIFDFYVRHTDGWQHDQMAAFYRETIATGLKEFDDAQHSDELYQAMAWRGLMGDGEIDPATGLPENTTVAWANKENKQEIFDIYNNFKKDASIGCH